MLALFSLFLTFSKGDEYSKIILHFMKAPIFFSSEEKKKKKPTGEIFILNLKRFLLREVKGNNTAQFECICVLILSSFSTQEHLFYFLNFSHYYSNVECHYLCLILFRKKKCHQSPFIAYWWCDIDHKFTTACPPVAKYPLLRLNQQLTSKL